MGLYSEAILKQMGQIGEPLKSTSKTTVKPPGPSIDLMQLLMMLVFSGAFQQKPGTIGDIAGEPMSAMQYGLQGGAAPGAPIAPPGVATAAGSPPTGGMGGTGDLAGLMKILMSIPGMGGMR